MKALAEIDNRLAEISTEIETRSNELTDEELTRFNTEVTNLKEERKAALDIVEKRKALLDSIAEGATGVTVRSFSEATNESDPFGTIEYRKAFMNHVLKGEALPAEYRADAKTFTTDIGAMIPSTVLNQIIQKLESVGMILPLVTRTAYRGGLTIPTNSVKPVASWVSEGQGSDKQKQPVTGTITFAYYKLRCAVAVTLEVDTMAMSAFENLLISNITEAMIKALETAIINGTGIGRPKGILAETPPAGQALSITALSYDTLTEAEAAIPMAYEAGVMWCMSKKTFMAFSGLTDTAGQPIARVNYGIGGKPERTLLGRSVVLCDYVTSYASGLAAGTVFAFLFNFKDYVLNTNYAMGIKRYEDNDTDDFITRAIMLVDGKVVETSSLVTLKAA